jgi:phosphoribosylglycinamide formyltransferase-1
MTDPHARPVVVLISGRGSNMEAIVAGCRAPHSHGTVRAVLSDRQAAPGLDRARDLGIPARCLAPRTYADRESYDRALADQIAEFEPAVIALAGFMRILSPAFVRRFTGRLLNVHPSLLPKYRGLDTHRRVLAAGEREHGASVHFVTEELDAGPVIYQARVPVQPGDSVDALSARVQSVEHIIYPRAVDLLASGRLELRGEQAYLDEQPLAEPLTIPSMESTAP